MVGLEEDKGYLAARERLLREIAYDMRKTAHETGRDRLSPPVQAALEAVPRHRFVPADERPYAYDNRPLPIGQGQTISQPFVVALMTEMLDLTPDSVVLEIGAGSGYQAAVLAEIAARVYSLEVRPEIAESARRRLADLGYDNVEVVDSDGYEGLAEHAPYDAIMVTAAAPIVPPALMDQLRPGGRMMIPVGSTWGPQDLKLILKSPEGDIEEKSILRVAFVPLVSADET